MEWDTECDTSGTHGVRYKSGTHTELDPHGMGYTRSGIHMEWNTHGVGHTRCGIDTEWDTHGVG